MRYFSEIFTVNDNRRVLHIRLKGTPWEYLVTVLKETEMQWIVDRDCKMCYGNTQEWGDDLWSMVDEKLWKDQYEVIGEKF